LTADRVHQLLVDAGHAWTTAQGDFHYWRDIAAANAEFEVHGALSATSRATTVREIAATAEETLQFRVDNPSGDLDVDARDQRELPTRPQAVRIRGTHIEARFGSEWKTITSGPSSIGGVEFLSLLRPDSVHNNVDLHLAKLGAATVAGRSCIAVDATAKEPDHFGHTLGAPELFAMVAGGTNFRLYIDDALGVLMRVEKIHNGAVAELAEFTRIVFDQ
jgi:hypothetical protein